MAPDEIRERARRIIEMHNEECEFCLVYEDDELKNTTEDELRAIRDAMYAARVDVSWPEVD